MRKQITIEFEIFDSVESLSTEERTLVQRAQEASEKAYAPYSCFHVGAALQLDNGEILAGNNQENASYPAGLCAERVVLAFTHANYAEHRVERMAISARNANGLTEDPVVPCGSCLQFMQEIELQQEGPISLVLLGQKKVYRFASVSDLLPVRFHSKFLS